MKYVLAFIFFNVSVVLNAQENITVKKETTASLCKKECSINNSPETSLIEQTLQDYIKGSSYNELELLESAFYNEATLYLTVRDEFKKMSPKEYCLLFKGSAKGTFNGRYGKIQSIDIVKDIATATVEISIPARKWTFIDLFLLKKTTQGWKIISKTATKI